MRFVKNVMMDYLNGRNQKNKLDKNSIIGGEYGFKKSNIKYNLAYRKQ